MPVRIAASPDAIEARRLTDQGAAANVAICNIAGAAAAPPFGGRLDDLGSSANADLRPAVPAGDERAEARRERQAAGRRRRLRRSAAADARVKFDPAHGQRRDG